MNIITKFNIGDTAFRLHENKVQEVEVAHIGINIRPAILGPLDPVEIKYTFRDIARGNNGTDNYEYEGTLFATKAELLASL